MPESLREFLERYRFSDYSLKVVGVGSVGTRCFMIALQGRDESDPLILQPLLEVSAERTPRVSL